MSSELGVLTEEQERQHEEMYYTACRVRADRAGGSGILIYSEYDEELDEVVSLVLTNHHVVEGLISVQKQWDSTLKREYPQENTEAATVEFFAYNEASKAVGSESYKADIVAWDDKERRDIALLRLRDTENVLDHVAELYPYEKRKQIYMFDKVYAVGAALGLPVFQTPGEVTNASFELGQQRYIGTNSPITFGNSGGGLFKAEADGGYYLIGLPARVQMQGFGDVASHIGFAVPIDVLYQFMDENWFNYVWEESASVQECREAREKMQQEAKENLLA